MLSVSLPASADELQVIISGKAMHLGPNNQNEQNYRWLFDNINNGTNNMDSLRYNNDPEVEIIF
jgi:hypothetical protein